MLGSELRSAAMPGWGNKALSFTSAGTSWSPGTFAANDLAAARAVRTARTEARLTPALAQEESDGQGLPTQSFAFAAFAMPDLASSSGGAAASAA